MTVSRPSRRAGVLVPLFSLHSSRSWGIGEIGDIAAASQWLRSAGQRLLQLLPINEMPPGETSPYSALSAMAIDPQYISLGLVEDFVQMGGESALDPGTRSALREIRTAPAIDYRGVRELKRSVLRRVFGRFHDVEWAAATSRAAAFSAYCEDQAWWLDDYALFRSLHGFHQERSWADWPEPLRTREPRALDRARAKLRDEILYHRYVQWVADEQWKHARAAADGVALFGDLPFMVGWDSADVWARQDEFRLDASVGVPPDAFSESGQDWGLPLYRWDVLAARGFDWLRDRARRNADLYDGYRVDHLVGFYRTYFRPHDGSQPRFTPEDEASQTVLGERVLAVFREPGAEIIAEDLGTVPDFVRKSLARLGVPGYKVLRWEREWRQKGQPFVDPENYATLAVATSGTHDTEPLAVWWDEAPFEEKQAVLAIPSVRDRMTDRDRVYASQAKGLPPMVHQVLLEVLYASAADILLLPIQDLFGWTDRVNRPATVASENWTWRMPWPVDRLESEPAARAVATQLREWSARYGRTGH